MMETALKTSVRVLGGQMSDFKSAYVISPEPPKPVHPQLDPQLEPNQTLSSG